MNPKTTGRIQGITGGVMTGAVALGFVLANWGRPVAAFRAGDVVYVQDAHNEDRVVSGVVSTVLRTDQGAIEGTLFRLGIVINGVWRDDEGAVTLASGTPLQLYDVAGGSSVDARIEWVSENGTRASISVADGTWQANDEWLPDLERVARMREDVDALEECWGELARASTGDGT